MEIGIRLSPLVYDNLKRDKDGNYVGKVHCTLKVGVETLRIDAIAEHHKKVSGKTKQRKAFNAVREHHDDVIKLGRAYARVFLSREDYTMGITDPAYKKFTLAVKLIKKGAAAVGMDYITMRKALIYVLRTEVAQGEKSMSVQPGHFCADFVWKNVLPMYLAKTTPPERMQEWPVK